MVKAESVLEKRESLYPVKILDVYEGNVLDVGTEKARGVRGIICKGFQGGRYCLPESFIQSCDKAGLPWGIYGVIDSRIHADRHLECIFSHFGDSAFGKLGWWWDIEKPKFDMKDSEYQRTLYKGNALIERVLDGFYEEFGVWGGVYTNLGFSKLLGWNSLQFSFSTLSYKLSRMPLWAAQYNNYIYQPTLFGPWRNWRYWQFKKEPDMNYFNGSIDEFEKMVSDYGNVPNR